MHAASSRNPQASSAPLPQPPKPTAPENVARDAEELAADNAAVIARLSAALENPALSDLVLRSERDGSETRAAAILLASCSPVFTKMLTGAFAEGADRGRKRRRDGDTSAAAPPVRCEFSGEALAAVVAFAATNDAPGLWSGSVELMCEILEASEYYDIEGLGGKTKRHPMDRAREVPAETCEVLQAVWGRWATDEFGDGSAGEVAKAVLAVIEGSADVSLMDCGCLCEEAMEKVLGGRSSGVGEAGKFTALQKWLSVDEESRRAAGGRLVPCLSLERMPPTFVADIVAKSGLVSKAVMFDALQSFVMKAELGHGLFSPAYDASALPNWCSSASAEFICRKSGEDDDAVGLLDLSLNSGCWTWEIRAEKMSGHFQVGFVTGDVDPEELLGRQACAYRYASNGACYGARKFASRGPPFSEGDTIRLTLDCNTGTLITVVNEGTPHRAFPTIQQSNHVKYFRPAVSLGSGSHARILSFSRFT